MRQASGSAANSPGTPPSSDLRNGHPFFNNILEDEARLHVHYRLVIVQRFVRLMMWTQSKSGQHPMTFVMCTT